MPARRQFTAETLTWAAEQRGRGRSWAWITRTHPDFVGSDQRRVMRHVGAHMARISGTVAAEGLTFGIEIEFRRPTVDGDYIDPEVIAAALREAGVDAHVEGYNHSTRSHWKLISDGSSDRELVSPILRGEDGLRQVRAAMRVLRGFGCTVGASEGMHVHIGAGHLDSQAIGRIVDGYYRNRNRFDSVVARGRRNNGSANYYCTPLNSYEVRRVQQQVAGGTAARHLQLSARCFTVNLEALRRHGTVEFRQHQGTLNGTKATAWVRLLLGFFEAAAAGDVPTYATVREMAEAFGVAAPSVEFLARRAGEQQMAVAS